MLRMFNPDSPDDREDWLQEARRQAGRLARARHPAVPRIVTVGQTGAATYIVSELVSRANLAAELRQGPLDEARIINLGRTLAGALRVLHELGLVHRNMRPENVVLKTPREPVLVNFDLPAPRPVDPRADLYSLGALLFECAIGHSDGAVDPNQMPVLRDLNPAISPALAAVIAKLLATDAEDRYQSAEALLSDLDLLLAEDDGRRTDDADGLIGLIGRDEELATLRRYREQSVREHGQLVFLSGPTGTGKSCLAESFLGELKAAGSFVLSGRCMESDPTPFGSLRRALDAWLGELGRLTGAERTIALQRLRIAAGDFAALLTRLSPAFGDALGVAQWPLESDLLRERFYDIVAEFLLKLAGCHGGMTLFLDDVQWLDSSSQQVLARVQERLEQAPLLIIGAVRTDTYGERARPIAPLNVEARLKLALTPLSDAATGQLIARLLGQGTVGSDVVEHVASWTGGNPLAIGAYVEAVVDAGLLRPEWGSWVLDTAGVDQLELPHDVAQLVSGRVATLSQPVADLLTISALMGPRVRTDHLQLFATDPEHADIRAAIGVGLERNLIRRVGPREYEFTHDSVREALTAPLSPAMTMGLHQRIGEALVAFPHALEDEAEHLFAVARHLRLGHAALDWERVYDTSFAAGMSAMRSFADAEAYDLLQEAAGAAKSAGLTADPALHEALGDICSRAGRWDEAREHFTAALDSAADPLRQAGLHARLAQVRLANRETVEAWSDVKLGFAAMGAPISRSVIARVVHSAWSWLVGVLALRVGWGYGSAKGARRERLQMLSRLYVIGCYTTYLLHDYRRMGELVVRQLYNGHLLGDSVEMAGALTSYANLLAILGRPAAAQPYSSRSLDIMSRLGDRLQLARMRMFDAWQKHVGGLPRQGEAAMRHCLQLDEAWLDAADSAFGHIDLAWNLMMRGYCREALSFIESALARAQPGTGESRNLDSKAAALLAVLGRSTEALERVSRARESDLDGYGWLRDGFYSYLILVLLELGDLGEPLDAAIQQYHKVGHRSPRQTAFHGRHVFVFKAYARLQQCVAETNELTLSHLSEAIRQLGAVSRHPTLRSHHLVLRGAFERLSGDPRRALKCLLGALEVTLEADNLWAHFELRRQLAHTLAALNNHQGGLRQAREAYRMAVSQGWVNRAKLVRAEFDGLRAAPASAFGLGSALADDRDEDQPERLEKHLEALLQVSLAASSTLDPGRQAQVALDEILGVLQGERAFLFVMNPYGELELRAGRSAGGADVLELGRDGRDVVDTVRVTGQPIITGSERRRLAPAEDRRSIIAAPLLMKGDLLGVVYVDTQLGSGTFTEEDSRILTAIGNHIAIALQNANTLAQQTALTRANSDLLDTFRTQVAELRESRRQITAAEERLRREISEMLHSQVQSKLLVAAHQLGQVIDLIDADPDEAKRLLNLSQEQLDDVREHEIRNASHLLHPSIIKIGLTPAVRSLVSRFEGVFEIALELDPRLAKMDSIVDNRLPEELRLAAYRVAEEALANVARHTKATHVRVALSLSADHALVLRVVDDGAGFDSAGLQPGLGLSSIDGRVNQLGGSWSITSERGRGTTVEVTLPLDSPLAADPELGPHLV